MVSLRLVLETGILTEVQEFPDIEKSLKSSSFVLNISHSRYSTNYVSLHFPLYPCLNYPIVYGLHIVISPFCDALISKRIQSTGSMNRTKFVGISKNLPSEVLIQSNNDENQKNPTDLRREINKNKNKNNKCNPFTCVSSRFSKETQKRASRRRRRKRRLVTTKGKTRGGTRKKKEVIYFLNLEKVESGVRGGAEPA